LAQAFFQYLEGGFEACYQVALPQRLRLDPRHTDGGAARAGGLLFFSFFETVRPTAMPESSEYTKILCLRTRPTYAFLAVFPTGDRIQ
jgi:hypothetical protein